MSMLKTGQVVTAAGGERLVVKGLLGEGGQGEVYEVEVDGQRYAFKVYHPPADDAMRAWAREQRPALAELCRRQPPSEHFIWPRLVVELPGVHPTFGYLMDKREQRFESFERVYLNQVPTNMRLLATASLQLVTAFKALHLSGLVYKDINLGGFALDPRTGEVRIVDNDNVRVNGTTQGGILFPGFSAPEVVDGGPCTMKADDHAMAVLLFHLFCRSNPFEGRIESSINCFDANAQRRLFGEHALFIYHPTDTRNRPVPGEHQAAITYWPRLGRTMQDAFNTAFVDGLHDPHHRFSDGQWIRALGALRDSLFDCMHCGREVVFDRQAVTGGVLHPCVKCGRNTRQPPRLALDDGREVVLAVGTRLYEHHLDRRCLDVNRPVGEVVTHPQNPALWGIRNLSADTWSMVGTDGKPQAVPPGRNVSVRDGGRCVAGRGGWTIRF